MRRSDDEAELVSDWKFAAMVVDRYIELLNYRLFALIIQFVSIQKRCLYVLYNVEHS